MKEKKEKRVIATLAVTRSDGTVSAVEIFGTRDENVNEIMKLLFRYDESIISINEIKLR